MNKYTKIFLTEMLLIILICSFDKLFILAFMWVILHELSHIIIAWRAGCKFLNMELHIFGARVNLVDLEYVNDKQKLKVYLAGPAINIIIAMIFWALSFKNQSQFIQTNIDLNIGLTIFNLLPAYPLDGARIYEILLAKKITYKKARKYISICSYFVAGLLLVIFLVMAIYYDRVNISILLSTMIIIYLTKKEQENTMYITMGNIIKKRKKLIKNKYIENRSVAVYYKYYLVNVFGLVESNKFNIFYVLDDEMKMIYILYEDELITALKKYGNITLEEYTNTVKCKL